MRRPLALKLYLALNGAQTSRDAQWQSRYKKRKDDGSPVVWVHCEQRKNMSVCEALALRMLAQREDFTIVMTVGKDGDLPQIDGTLLHYDQCPSENMRDVQAFLEHWRPNIGLWYQSDLRPLLLDTVFGRDVPMVLVDGSDDIALAPHLKTSRGVRRGLLRQFASIFATSPSAVALLRKLSAPTEGVVDSQPIQISPPALECDEEALQRWSEILTTRPIWLAAQTDEDDEAPLILAHRQILRAHHRLLLTISPRDSSRGLTMAKSLIATGWNVAIQSQGEQPDDATQVLIADVPDTLPMWYRLAPVSFLGGTFSPAPATNPLEAASLGSAVLHGPRTTPYESHYRHFLDAGAARDVRTPDQLAMAVNDLLAPQRVAAMAHRAWDIITQGAEATDHVIDLVETQLDEMGY